MSLEKYNKKRNFKETSEPAGKKVVKKKTPAKKTSVKKTAAKKAPAKTKKAKKPSESELIFVIQKHSASHLHYDFRLELGGVLLSWAVPKGPSLDPSVKRLAMMVEDHPFDYKDFEGIIPKGNYGAGEVIVWDNGVYIPEGGSEDKEDNEKILRRMLHKGDMKFVMLGKKVKGEFALVKMKTGKENDNAWLLIKKEDEYASDEDLTEKNKSVISKKSIESLKKLNKKSED